VRKSLVALTAILLIVSGLVLAQKRVEVPGKRVGHAAPHVRTHPTHNGSRTLDDFYGSTDVPKNIPDLGSVSSILTITDDVQITRVNVHVVITHTWMRDLHATLINPDSSVRVSLFDVLPLDNAVNMDVWFDDNAEISIMDADTPLVGTFRPAQPLAALAGHSTLGTWTMTVLDTFPLDVGTLDAWGIDVNPVVTLRGTITNAATHAPVFNALVDLVGSAYSTHSNSAGYYEFLHLDSSGTYSVRFTKAIRDTVPWYDTLTVDNIGIELGSTTQLDTAIQTLANHGEYASTSAPVFIPDPDTTGGSYVVTPVFMPLRVSASGVIADIKVLLNITHTYDSDLAMMLRSPGGDTVLLANAVGDSSDNFINTLFDDSAAQSVANGHGPFTGTYRPLQLLRTFRDSTLNGQWQLIVVDSAAGDTGSLHGFTLEVLTQPGEAATPREPLSLPTEYSFTGNFPNPFNGQTEFRFDLARQCRVELVLYNTLGQKVADIAQGTFDAGSHVLSFDATRLASGVYLARFTYNGASARTRKVLLLR
jgi:subtilisin-like proprotein convertase family protein